MANLKRVKDRYEGTYSASTHTIQDRDSVEAMKEYVGAFGDENELKAIFSGMLDEMLKMSAPIQAKQMWRGGGETIVIQSLTERGTYMVMSGGSYEERTADVIRSEYEMIYDPSENK